LIAAAEATRTIRPQLLFAQRLEALPFIFWYTLASSLGFAELLCPQTPYAGTNKAPQYKTEEPEASDNNKINHLEVIVTDLSGIA
jgi:hypothetical protein